MIYFFLGFTLTSYAIFLYMLNTVTNDRNYFKNKSIRYHENLSNLFERKYGKEYLNNVDGETFSSIYKEFFGDDEFILIQIKSAEQD